MATAVAEIRRDLSQRDGVEPSVETVRELALSALQERLAQQAAIEREAQLFRRRLTR